MKDSVVIVLAVVLTASAAFGTIGDVWDAGVDLQVSSNPGGSNPFGVWTYRDGPIYNTIMPYSSGSPLPSTPGFTSNNVYVFGWNPSFPTTTNVLLGYQEKASDFCAASYHYTQGGPRIQWTSPIDGWIEISGKMYNQSWASDKVIHNWKLKQNGSAFAWGRLRINPAGTGTLTGLANALYYDTDDDPNTSVIRSVSVNDVIELELAHEKDPAYTWDSDYGGQMIASFIIEHMDPNNAPQFTLTMQVAPGVVNTISPPAGDHLYIGGSHAVISASTYIDCPSVLVFDHWEGEGITDPASASTTVIMDADRTVTAVFVDGRECGDACHPISANDLNNDCIINLLDFQIVANEWLDCTQPVCD